VTALEWALCAAANPPASANIVSDDCLAAAVRSIDGQTNPVSATVPADACALFGPQPPPTPAGAPPARPRDPDATGGYYQPVRVRPLASDPAQPTRGLGFGMVRISCGLAGASADVAAAFRDRYQVNRNPQLTAVWATDGASGQPKSELPRAQVAQLHARFSPDSAEPFPILAPGAEQLTDARESLQLAWFADGGRFALAHTAPPPGATDDSNSWTAPDTAGPVTVWIVLRDSRGGVDFTTLTLSVR
jgi:hypothetical protein